MEIKVIKIDSVEDLEKCLDDIKKELEKTEKEENADLDAFEKECDYFITNLLTYSKTHTNSEEYAKDCDEYKEYLLKQPLRDKASFAKHYAIGVKDIMDDIFELVAEHSNLHAKKEVSSKDNKETKKK